MRESFIRDCALKACEAYERGLEAETVEAMANIIETAIAGILLDYEAEKWQLIETADRKHGFEIVAELDNGRVVMASFDSDAYCQNPRPFWNWNPWRRNAAREHQPVRWQPVPRARRADPEPAAAVDRLKVGEIYVAKVGAESRCGRRRITSIAVEGVKAWVHYVPLDRNGRDLAARRCSRKAFLTWAGLEVAS